jgi:RimJ/RimL family protein N-acetyltransferase
VARAVADEATAMTTKYRPRRLRLRDGREVTLRAIVEADAPEIAQAFERLSPESRYYRFMQHMKQLDSAALERGVHPRPGLDFAFVATIPAADGIDIVGAAQYVRAGKRSTKTCEFAITVAEDWRGSGLATKLLGSLIRRARRDGYATMQGLVIARNAPMLALARKLKFTMRPATEDATVVSVQRALEPAKRPRPQRPKRRTTAPPCDPRVRSWDR